MGQETQISSLHQIYARQYHSIAILFMSSLHTCMEKMQFTKSIIWFRFTFRFFIVVHYLQNITLTIFTEITWNTKREEIKQLIQRAFQRKKWKKSSLMHSLWMPAYCHNKNMFTKYELPKHMCNVLTADIKMSTHIKPLKLARFLKSTQRTHYFIKTWAYPSVTLSRQFIFYQLLNQTEDI